MKKILFLVSAVLLLAAGCGKSVTQNGGNQQPTPSPQQTAAEPMPSVTYITNDDNFSVKFPEAPQVSKSNFNSPGAGSIVLTQYIQQFVNGSGNAWYKVYVYHYPASYTFSSGYLAAALKDYVAVVNIAFPGTQIASQQSSQFLGAPSISGIISVPVGESPNATTNDYVLITINDHNVYAISGYGVSKDDYNIFLNSFKFLK